MLTLPGTIVGTDAISHSHYPKTGICPGPLPRASIVDIDIAQDYSMAMARK
jgi:hypothetical protein